MSDITPCADAIKDLCADAQLFQYILHDLEKKLTHARKNTKGVSFQFFTAADEMVYRTGQSVSVFIEHINAKKTSFNYSSLYRQKESLIADLHVLIGVIGQACVASHWQSPAVDQSVIDQVGNIRGKIIVHYNDYTRDQHVLGSVFEKRYRNEYIRVFRMIPVYAYATSSGMAAITTAALLVLGESAKNTIVLLGSSCYFETKQLLKNMFGSRLHEVDLTNVELLSQKIQQYSPIAIFADTIGNEPDMRIVDGLTLIRQMSRSSATKKYVVLDTSASAYMHRLMKGIAPPKNIMLIGVESQNKLLQFGFDRVTAGIVWGTGFEAMKLYDYRDHAGSICPDLSLAALPTPNKYFATQYIRRLERNTKMLVGILNRDERVAAKRVLVVYPKKSEFCGVYCMLTWRERPFRTFDGYIGRVMKKAKREKIPLVHGTSFGFHTTRIYTVAMHTQYGKPFLRISPGTETEDQMYQIAHLLIDSL